MPPSLADAERLMHATELLRDHAEKIASAIESRAPHLTSTPEQMSRHVAAAGLLRCCVLLRGILALDDADLSILGHILARQHWETWLVTFHVLVRGDDALQDIAGDDIHWKRTLSKALQLGSLYQPQWAGSEGRLNYKNLADQLSALLQKAGEPPLAEGMNPYDISYRVQSLFAVHANLATIGAHIVYGDQTWSLKTNPPDPFGEPAATPALHTAHLARYVFKEFGVTDDGGVEAMGDALLEALKQHTKTTAAEAAPS